MGSTESKFAGTSLNFTEVPFINTATYAYQTMVRSTQMIQSLNYGWFGLSSPRVLIVNSNNLITGNNYGNEKDVVKIRKNSNGQQGNIVDSLITNGTELVDKYELLSGGTSLAEFRLGEVDCSEEEALILDKCWSLANQLTTANPVKAKLNVKASQIDFDFEIENGNVSLCIDGHDQTEECKQASIDNDEFCSQGSSLVKGKEDGMIKSCLTESSVLNNYLDDVQEHNKQIKTLSFGLDDETCVYFKSSSEASSPESEDVDYEKERMNRLDFLKDQLMSTLKSPEYIEREYTEGGVVEICAQIEEEISLSRRALSVVSEYSEPEESGGKF